MADAKKLHDIEAELAKFYQISTRDDFVLQVLSNKKEGAPTTGRSPARVFAGAVVDLQDSGLFMHEIISAMENAAKELSTKKTASQDAALTPKSQFVFISGNKKANNEFEIFPLKPALNPNPPDIVHEPGGKDQRNIAFAMVNNMNLVPARKNSNIISLFLNAIPTIELSKCVPFLRVDITTGRETYEGGRLQGLSLHRFLNGAVKADRAPLANTQNVPTGLDDAQLRGNQQATTNQTGMEIFLSPQTLVPAGPISSAAPIIDRFRPFMSIKQFIVDVVPAMGMMSYKSGKLSLVLHDRSRLAEIADFINPNLFSRVELQIEFGWSHPDSVGETGKVHDNIYGDLINAMRVREKYGIRNVQFEFTDNGEVQLDLDIYIKGSAQLKTINISDDGKYAKDIEVIRTLKELLSTLTRDRDVQNKIKEIRATQVLRAATNTGAPLISMTKEMQAELRRISKLSSPDFQRIKELLARLYGETQKGKVRFTNESGIVGTTVKSLRTIIKEQLDVLDENTAGNDPFLHGNAKAFLEDATKSAKGYYKKYPREVIRRLGGGTGKKGPKTRFISMGKLLSRFVATPLVGSGQFQEVQVLTYPLNEAAGLVAGLNVAQFPINVQQFKDRFSTLVAKRNSADISIAEFLVFLNNAFFDDSGSATYGMNAFYKSEWNSKTLSNEYEIRNWITERAEKHQKKGTTVASIISNRLKTRYAMNGGEFKLPHIDVMIEAYPAKSDPTKTILRLHIFDSSATPYSTLADLLAAHRGEKLFKIAREATKTIADYKAADFPGLKSAKTIRKNYVKALLDTNKSSIDIFEKSGGGLVVKGGANGIKDLIMSSVPSIIYGSQNTAVADAQLTSVHIPELSTVHMLRTGVGGSTTPTGLNPGNMPLRIIPTQLELTTFGCPLLMYGQQFFVDFGTNTTADNIYGIIKLTQEIHPGGFQSKVTMWPIDAYGQYESPFKVMDDINDMVTKAEAQARKNNAASNVQRKDVRKTAIKP